MTQRWERIASKASTTGHSILQHQNRLFPHRSQGREAMKDLGNGSFQLALPFNLDKYTSRGHRGVTDRGHAVEMIIGWSGASLPWRCVCWAWHTEAPEITVVKWCWVSGTRSEGQRCRREQAWALLPYPLNCSHQHGAAPNWIPGDPSCSWKSIILHCERCPSHFFVGHCRTQ